MIGFTSGNIVGSVSQPNYSAAKGGIASLVRSAALAMHKYGVTANAVAPIARTRMSANVPTVLDDMGEPEDVAALVVYLLSDAAGELTGQVYTAAGPKIAVWEQPAEARAMYARDGWTAEEVATWLPRALGQERLPTLDQVTGMAKAASTGERPNQ